MQLEGGSIHQRFWRFLLPSIVAQWVFALYAMVDGMFVARGVGEVALSAVNLAMPYLNVLFSLSILFAVGSSTTIAIFLGQGDGDAANRSYTQNFWVLLVFSALMMAATACGIEPLAKFLGADGETLPYVVDYIRSILPFSWCFILSYSFEILVKTDGYPRFATMVVTFGALLNCLLDYLFVMVFHWGIWGAGFATGLSQFSLMLLYGWHFMSNRTHLRLVRLRFDPRALGRVIRIGLSAGVTEVSAGVMIFLFNRAILQTIGESGIISYTILSYVNTIVVMSMVGLAQGVQPLLSFCHGKQDLPSCRILLKKALRLTAVFGLVCCVGGILAAPQLVSWFLPDRTTSLFAVSVTRLRIFAISFLPVGFSVVASGLFAAVEQPAASLAISISRGFVTVTLSLAACVLLVGGEGIWWAAALSEGLTLLLTLLLALRYRRLHPASPSEGEPA